MFSRGVALFERVQFTKDACVTWHGRGPVFLASFEQGEGIKELSGSTITESITRIAINTVHSPLSVSTNVRESRELSTRAQIEIKPAIFPHSMNNRARRKCQVRSVRCFTSNEMFVVYNTLVWFVFDIFKCSISDIWYNARINVAGNVLMRILDAVRFCFIGYESMNASNIYYIKRISNYSFKIEVKIHILMQ